MNQEQRVPDVRVGEIALDRGLITREQIEECLRIQRSASSHKPLGNIMVQLGFITEKELESLLTQQDVGAAPAAAPPKKEAKPRGKPFGSYELLTELWRDDTGVFYRAIETSSSNVSILKIIPVTDTQPVDEVKRLMASASASAKIRHPNIISVYDVGVVGGVHYYTMDNVEGWPLDKMVADGAIPMADALRVLVQACEILNHAHKHGAVHGNLRTSSLIVDKELNTYVLGFRMAPRVESRRDLTYGGVTYGAPSYMAPEVARNEDISSTPLADIYALGAILYEILTKRPPFVGKSATDVLFQVLHGDPPPAAEANPLVPRDLDLVRAKAMHKDRTNRYQSAIDLARDIHRVVDGQAPEARTADFYETLRTFLVTRKRKLIPAAIAAAVILIGVAIFVPLLPREKPQENGGSSTTPTTGPVVTEDEPSRLVKAGLENLKNLHQFKAFKEAKPFFQKAMTFFDEAIQKAPAKGDAYYHRARLWMRLGEEKKAYEDVNKALELDRNDPVALTLRSIIRQFFSRRLAEGAESNEWAEKAKDDLKLLQAVGTEPQFGHFASGMLLLFDNKLDEAKASFDCAMGAHATFEYAFHERGLVHAAMAEMDLALTDFNSIHQIVGPSFQVYLERGDIYFSNGRLAEAKAEYEQAARVNQHHPLLYFMFGQIQFRKHDYQSALFNFTEAVSRGINLSTAYSMRGFCYASLEQFEQALADYTKSLDINPDSALAYAYRGDVLRSLGRLDEADQNVRKSLQIDSELAPAHNAMGLLNHARGYPKKAESDFTQAIRIDKDHADAYHNRGIVRAETGQLEAALKDISRSLSLRSGNIKAYLDRGRIHLRLDHLADAEKDFSTVIQFSSQDENAHFLRALIYIKKEELPKAIDDLSAAIAVNDRKADYFYTRGLCFLKLGEKDKALADIDRSVGLDPNNAEALMHRGILIFELDMLDEARHYLDSAIQLNASLWDAYHYRGKCLLKLEEKDKAISDWSYFLENAPLDHPLRKETQALFNEATGVPTEAPPQ